MSLIKITSPTAAPIAANYNPHPEAKALLKPTQTPTQYTEALQNGSFSHDHIHFLAHGMPDRESVGWACKSSAKVGDKLEPADKSALGAAQNWVKNPTKANQAAAGAAAAKTNYQGPGAWAAQGAAWAKKPGAPAKPGAPHLTGHAVGGSVLLAAALSVPKAPAAPAAPKAPALQAPQKPALPKAPVLQMPQKPAMPKAPVFQPPQTPAAPKPPSPPSPAERAEMAKVHQPFIDQGHAIASGKESFT